MTHIKPTVGRVVWYQPNDHDAKALGAGDQPLAAHVAYVHSDTMVNLLVIDPNGYTHSRTSVRLVQAGESPHVGESFCEWMPYQVGQAAKHNTPLPVSGVTASGEPISGQAFPVIGDGQIPDVKPEVSYGYENPSHK